MKIRHGFVSNSSSSSFIVFVPQNDKTFNSQEELTSELMKEWGCEEDVEVTLSNIKNLGEDFKKNVGCVIIDAEYGCEGSLREISEKLGTKFIELE